MITLLYIIGNAEKEKKEFHDMLKDLRIQAKFEVCAHTYSSYVHTNVIANHSVNEVLMKSVL